MRVLVTGGSGFIGRFLVESFVRDNARVTSLVRRASQAGPGSGDSIVHDLTAGVPELPAFDLVVHAAAVHPTGTIPATPTALTAGNVGATLNLCRSLEKHPPKLLVFLSAASIYGSPEVDIVDENTEPRLPSPYGMSKLAAEQILSNYRSALRSVSLRLPGVYGPANHGPWLGRLLKRALAGEAIEVTNSQGPFNHMVHLEDLYRLLQHLMGATAQLPSVVNVGTEEPLLVERIVRSIVRLTKSPSAVNMRPGINVLAPLGIRRLTGEVGYHPLTTSAAIARYFEGLGYSAAEVSRALDDVS